MYKSKKDTYQELKSICSLIMNSLADIENGRKANIARPLIEDSEYNAYIQTLESYLKIGNIILDNWETLYSNDIQGFFAKLESYLKFLADFIDEPTIEKQLRLSSIYDSLEELASSFKISL